MLEAVLSDDATLSELGLKIAVDLTKAVIAGVAGYLAGAALTAAGIACLPLAGAIVVGVAVGFVLDYFVPTDKIVAAMQGFSDSLLNKAARLLNEIERQILWQIWPHHAIPFPY